MATIYQVERKEQCPVDVNESNAVVPSWVNDTPDETTYELIMWDEEGCSMQNISLGRDEFKFLKRELAIRRGYKPDSLSTSEIDPHRVPRSEGAELTRDALIEYTRGAFEGWVQHVAAPLDLYLLHQVFGHAETDPRPLADVLMEELGLQRRSVQTNSK